MATLPTRTTANIADEHVADHNALHTVYNRRDTTANPWVDVTLVNGWVNAGSGYANAGYMIDASGFVHLRGAISSGTANVDAFVLPSGFRPATQSLTGVVSGSLSNVLSYVLITPAGAVQVGPNSTTFVMLDIVQFRVA